VEEQLAAEREAFEARFPTEAFRGIATALKVRPTPENLSYLSGRLLPAFYFCLDVRHRYKEPTPKELLKLLKKLSNAASTLHSAVTSADYTFCLSWAFDAPDEGAVGVTDHFIATLELLAKPTAGQIEKFASGKSRRGRPFGSSPPHWSAYTKASGKSQRDAPTISQIAAFTVAKATSIVSRSLSGAASKTISPRRLVPAFRRPRAV
jgi:hypothetical protein